MLKKTVKYTDFNGEPREEDLYFHLKKVDIIRLELAHEGGLKASMERIIKAENGKVIMEEMEGFIKASYGVKSPDGKRHIKSEEIWLEFSQSNAYDVFFMELVMDAELSANFITSVMPPDLMEEAVELAKQQTLEMDVETVDVKQDARIYTQAEIKAMPAEQFLLLAPLLASGEAVVEDVK